MKLKDAIDFWVTESGYRRIQDALSRKAHGGETKYALAEAINAPTTNTNIEDVISTLLSAMEPASAPATYYRGSPSGIKETHRREGFFAVARTPEKAASYGSVYTVHVDPDVPRLSFSAEGGEILLGPGMIYEYIGATTVHVRTPKTAADSGIPFLGNLYKRRTESLVAKNIKEQKYLISRIYCFAMTEPDPDLGYMMAGCDSELLSEFEKRPIKEQIEALKTRLFELKETGHLELFKKDIPSFFTVLDIPKEKVLGVINTTIESFTGGRRRQTRKNRNRTRSKKTRLQRRR